MCGRAEHNDGEVLRWMSLGLAIVQENAACELWDDELWHRLACIGVQQARDAGALAALPAALVFRAGAHLQAGEFASAQTLLEEADSIAVATGYAQTRYHSLSLPAWQGVPGPALAALEAAAAIATARGEGRLLSAVSYLTAVLHNGLARYEEALAAARDGCDSGDLGFGWWSLFEMVEAAVHTGQREVAEHAARRLEQRLLPSGTDFGLGFVASARALVADDDHAERLHIEAITRLERTRFVVHLVRARLRYGEWLRRVHRSHDARQHLSSAYEAFTRMGAQAFAERARRELVATGEKVRRQQLSSGDALTPQEAQIARLAGEGLTNPEIGAQLFISTHTVEWHLRKVFVKLDITSRRQLRTISWAS
jgi:DNA-binding CsgD family transcriptional regulator